MVQFTQQDMMISVAIIVILVFLYLNSVQDSHMGRHGFPCYCKKCEHLAPPSGEKGILPGIAERISEPICSPSGVLSPSFMLFVLILIAGGVYIFSMSKPQQPAQF